MILIIGLENILSETLREARAYRIGVPFFEFSTKWKCVCDCVQGGLSAKIFHWRKYNLREKNCYTFFLILVQLASAVIVILMKASLSDPGGPD